MEHLASMDEIIRIACIGIIVATAIGSGFFLSYLTYKTHIRDLQEHAHDLKEAILTLMNNINGTDN